MLGGCRLLEWARARQKILHLLFSADLCAERGREAGCMCVRGWLTLGLQHVATIISLRFYPARGTRAWEQLCGIIGVEGR